MARVSGTRAMLFLWFERGPTRLECPRVRLGRVMKSSLRRVRRIQNARLMKAAGAAPGGDPRPLPVNPYSLLVAINEASSLARTAWLASLAVIAWLFIAVAGVKHRDLLMGSEIGRAHV